MSNLESFSEEFNEADRTEAALGINQDIIDGLESGEMSTGDDRLTESMDAVEKLMGECNYPFVCKFYGTNPDFCDRSCSESIWDQI